MSKVRPAPLVIVLGNLASGKTTLAMGLAEEVGVCSFLESPRANPYLPEMQEDPAKICMMNQLWFLTEALGSIASALSTGGVLDHSVAEVVAVHSPVFARYGWLAPAELSLLHRVVESVSRLGDIQPDAYIALEATPLDLIDRIHARGRAEDVVPSVQYLDDITASRAVYIAGAESPVIRVNTSVVDIRDRSAVKGIQERLHDALIR